MLGHRSRRWPVTEILLDICILIIIPGNQRVKRTVELSIIHPYTIFLSMNIPSTECDIGPELMLARRL